MFEMMRLAKEARDVGRDRVDHLVTLDRALAALHKRTIPFEVFHAERTQTLDEARIDKRRLHIRQAYTGILIDHRGDLPEIAFRERKFAILEDVVVRLDHPCVGCVAHAASASSSGNKFLSARRQIMRSSTGEHARDERL